MAEKRLVQAAEPVSGPADKDVLELSGAPARELNKTVFPEKILGRGAAPDIGQAVGPQQVHLGGTGVN